MNVCKAIALNEWCCDFIRLIPETHPFGAGVKNRFGRFFPLTSAIDPRNPNDPRIVEKVFRGVHTDIGCCYQNDDSLSRDALFWIWNEAKSINVPFDMLPAEYMPVHPQNKKPMITYKRYMAIGRPHPPIKTTKPQQGSRYPHDSRYNKFSDAPRNVFYLRNPEPKESRKPYYFNSVKGPDHFNFLQEIYNK